MPFGLLDLSIVTDHLVKLLQDATSVTTFPTDPPVEPGTVPDNIPITTYSITVTGNAPDAARDDSDCLLSIYLYHVTPDPYQRNTAVLPGGRSPLTAPYQPLALDLYYLLSAYSNKRYIQEQQAMSLALKCLYENTLLKNVLLANDGRPVGEFSLTMEVMSSDEMGRLWQSFVVSNRLAAVYKVSVVFIQPQEPPIVVTKPVLSVHAAAVPSMPNLTGSTRHVQFIGPQTFANPAQKDVRTFDVSPAVAAAGETFLLQGDGLAGPIKLRLTGDGPDQIVDWVVSNTNNSITVQVPSPAGMDPGAYQLKVVFDVPDNQGGTIEAVSNATPFSLAPTVTPQTPPVLNYKAGDPALTIQGAGFLAGNIEVFLDSVTLTEDTKPAPVVAGQFKVVDATHIQLIPPAMLGLYGIQVHVNGVEATPALWVQLT